MSRRSRDDRLGERLRTAASLGFAGELVASLDSRGSKVSRFVGFCKSGHAVDFIAYRLTSSTKCVDCERDLVIQRHIDDAINAGLSVVVGERRDSEIWIVAKCSRGHLVELRGHRASGGCPMCRKDDADRERRSGSETQAKSEGYVTGWVNDSGDDYLVGVCKRQHPIRFRHDSFIKGARCQPCNVEDSREAWLSRARGEGYAVEVIPTRMSSGNLVGYLVGKCPEGHPVRIQGTKFFHYGTRCASCAIRGYNPSGFGHLYVLERRNSACGADAIQFGKSTSLASRLKKHHSSGFEIANPTLILGCADAVRISDFESAIKRVFAEVGVPSCFSHGDTFDGSTEAAFLADYPTSSLLGLVKSVGDEFGWTGISLVAASPEARSLFRFLLFSLESIDA
jgi:hypothetical protein